ncbi:hypothetical protein [Mesorhizobium sp. IMUNJ 23232]|uniref:hypothetical protein n=1 Tax=Mesorhizobium sp. IMUNJ 23232 TaxID=3376064 RepID=UPI0037CC73F2
METREDVTSVAPIPDTDFGQKVFDNFQEVYFKPELNRRVAAGTVKTPMRVTAAQVLFPSDGGAIVRFNEEVRLAARLKTPLQPEELGQTRPFALEEIERFDLPEDELDHGHFTVMRLGSGWRMAFSFIYGRKSARSKIDRAEEFLMAAKEANARGHTAVALDNIFSASELLSRVHLELHTSIKKGSKKHAAIASGINRWGKLGNIPRAFTGLFNRASNARDGARYRAVANSEFAGLSQAEIEVIEREVIVLRDQCAGVEERATDPQVNE